VTLTGISCTSLVQAHAVALKELQDQLDKAYEELSDMQFQSDQDKATGAAQQEKLQQELQVGLLHHCGWKLQPILLCHHCWQC
jgi:TolA-binding protein